METQRSEGRMGPVAFERLESRFLLDAGPLGEPEVCDGTDEAAATPAVVEAPADPCVWAPVCGVDGQTYGSSADGDGKLGLNDVKTSGADGGEDITPIIMWEWDLDCDGAPDDPVVPDEIPIVIDVLGSSEEFMDYGSAARPPVRPAELPIIMDVLGSTKDFEMTGPDGVVLQMSGAENDLDPDGVVIRMLGVHNDTSSAEADGIVIRMLGIDNDTETDEADGIVIRMVGVDQDERPIIIDILGSTEDFEYALRGGGPLGAIMGGIGGILGGGGGIGKMLGMFASSFGQSGGADSVPPDGLEPGTYVAEVWSSQGEL